MTETFFVVRLTQALAKWTENVGEYRFEGYCFRVKYGTDFSARIVIEKEGDYYLFKFEDKYLKTDGHWIRSADNYESSSYYILEENQDILEPKIDDFTERKPIKDLYYIKDKNSGQYLCMDDDGWLNVKNSGKYLLTYKY